MVCRYRATIEGNKIFMREYEFLEESSLYSLHLYIANDLGFSPDQMVLFKVVDGESGTTKTFALFDLGDGTMDKVSIGELTTERYSNLRYIYDTFKERALNLELLTKEERVKKRSYPQLIAERGKNPDQFSDNYDDFEQILDATLPDELFDQLSQSDSDE